MLVILKKGVGVTGEGNNRTTRYNANSHAYFNVVFVSTRFELKNAGNIFGQ